MFSLPILQVFSNMVAPTASASTQELSGGIMAREGVPEARPELDPGVETARDMASKLEATYQGMPGFKVPSARPEPSPVDLEIYKEWSAGAQDIIEAASEATAIEETFDRATFDDAVARLMESDHGSTPVPTKDSKEKDIPEAERSKDVGYGHKVTAAEEESGMIHGVPFKDADGNYISLTTEQKQEILRADMANQLRIARSGADGWDADLAERGSSWDELGEPYKAALTSLAFNVGGGSGRSWTTVLKAAIDEDVSLFAEHLRRLDNKKNTEGMDNRVMKELYYAGLIENRSEVADKLPLATAASGVPE